MKINTINYSDLSSADEYDLLVNNINLSVQFQYPTERTETKTTTEEYMNDKMIELLNRMASYIIPSRNPRLQLIAMFYASGVDMSYILNVSNSESALAKKLGISKQKFSFTVKKIRKELDLNHSSNIHQGKTTEVYKNNSRKSKI